VVTREEGEEEEGEVGLMLVEWEGEEGLRQGERGEGVEEVEGLKLVEEEGVEGLKLVEEEGVEGLRLGDREGEEEEGVEWRMEWEEEEEVEALVGCCPHSHCAAGMSRGCLLPAVQRWVVVEMAHPAPGPPRH